MALAAGFCKGSRVEVAGYGGGVVQGPPGSFFDPRFSVEVCLDNGQLVNVRTAEVTCNRGNVTNQPTYERNLSVLDDSIREMEIAVSSIESTYAAGHFGPNTIRSQIIVIESKARALQQRLNDLFPGELGAIQQDLGQRRTDLSHRLQRILGSTEFLQLPSASQGRANTNPSLGHDQASMDSGDLVLGELFVGLSQRGEDRLDDVEIDSAKAEALVQLYSSRPFRSASVLLVGTSAVHDTHVALLAGCVDQTGATFFGEFGANVNWGPDGKKLEMPHCLALLSLSEELFGLSGDVARRFAERIWVVARSNLIGNLPIMHGSHLVFLLSADVLNLAVGTGNIDALADEFCPGERVDDVALIELEDLLGCGEMVYPLTHLGHRSTRDWSLTGYASRAVLARRHGEVAIRRTLRGALPACAETLHTWVSQNPL